MTDVNPYAPPIGQSTANNRRGRFRGAGAWVLMHFVFSAWQIYWNWSMLAWTEFFGIVPFWLASPLAALYLVWRGRSLGRWILIGLFGLRAVGCLLYLAPLLAHGLRTPPIFAAPPVLANIIQLFAYSAATASLIFSRAMRNGPAMSGESNA